MLTILNTQFFYVFVADGNGWNGFSNAQTIFKYEIMSLK